MKVQLTEGKLKSLIENIARKAIMEYNAPFGNERDEVRNLIESFPDTITRISNNEVEFLGWDGLDYDNDEGLVIKFRFEPNGSFCTDSGLVDKVWGMRGVKTSFPSYVDLYEDGDGYLGFLPDYINDPAARKDPAIMDEYIEEIKSFI